MNPLGTNAQHELRFLRERPRLLEEKVDIPFCRVACEKWRNSQLEFQPVLYRRHLNRDSGAEARSAVCDTPVSSSPKLHDCGRLLVVRLCQGVSSAQKQERYQDGFNRVQWMAPYVATICAVKRKIVTLRGSERPCQDRRHTELTRYPQIVCTGRRMYNVRRLKK
jgi:hypothetical protein